MRVLVVVVLAAGCSGDVCDAREAARRLAGDDAVDCGSPEPYEGRGVEARELSVTCMVEAVEAGRPFFGLWLDACQLDSCFYEGRAFDGTRLWLVEQSILVWSPGATGDVRVAACTPRVRERQVDTPAGQVIRRELECVDPPDDDDGEVIDDCPTQDWEVPRP